MTDTLPMARTARRRLKISEALPAFLAYREVKDRTANTLDRDRGSVDAFRKLIGDRVVSTVTPEDLERFVRIRRDAGLKPRSINSDIRALRVFFKWATLRELTSRDPTVEVELQKVTRTPRLYIPRDKFRPLLDAADNPRSRIIIGVGLYLWTRQSEAITLRVGDVSLMTWEDESGIQRRGGRVDTQIHKTRGDDRMPISSRLYDELMGWRDLDGTYHQGWLEYYRRDVGVEELNPEWYLVPAFNQGNFWGRDEDGRAVRIANKIDPTRAPMKIHQFVKNAMAKIGYPTKQEGLHTLRRSGARAYYDRLRLELGHESAIRVIMAMLHHKDMRTTEIYLGVEADRVERDKLIDGVDMYGEEAREIAARAARENVIDLSKYRKQG